MSSARRVFPQSWNRYTYVLNNPINLTDPSGLDWGEQCKKGYRYCTYTWFEGKVPKGWKTVPNGTVITSFNDGKKYILGHRSIKLAVPIDIAGVRQGWLSQKDADAINQITGGAICSLTGGTVCLNEGGEIADKVTVAADVVQAVFLIKSLLKLGLSISTIAAVLKSSPDDVAGLVQKVAAGGVKGVGQDFFEGTRYSTKVLEQMSKTKDLYHSFPELIKLEQGAGTVSTIKGGDGIVREVLRIPGSLNGKTGIYEFIKESDGLINHRLFIPD